MGEFESNAILQKLLVDWDGLTSKDYNPIKNALKLNDPDSQPAVEFRNFYHKIDLEMNKIIQNKHQGFNDSIQMYNEIIYLYRKLDSTLESTENRINQINEKLNINTEQLDEEETSLSEQKTVFDALSNIEILFQQFSEFDERLLRNDFEFCSQTVIDILNTEMDEIGAIREIKHETYKKRRKLLKKMSQKLIGQIFSVDEIENEMNIDPDEKKCTYRQILGNLVRINGLLNFDEYLFENIKTTFFQKVSKIISESHNLRSIFLQSIHLALKINQIISELRNLLNLRDEENYYGKKFTKFKIFCEKGEENCKELLKNEICRLIMEYTVKEDAQKMDFDKDKLVDLVQYDTLFEKKYRIHETFKKKKINQNIYGDYKLIKKPSLRHIFLFNETINDEIESVKEIIRSDDDIENEMIDSFKDLQVERDENHSIFTSNLPKYRFENLKVSELRYLQDIKTFIDSQINEQMRIKDHNLKSTVSKIFQRRNRFYINSRSDSLNIFDEFLSIFSPYKKRIVFLHNFFWSIEYFIQHMNDCFSEFYKSEIIKVTIQDQNDLKGKTPILDCFKKQITIKMNHMNDMSLQKDIVQRKILLISGIKTLKVYFLEKFKEFEKIQKGEKGQPLVQALSDLENMYTNAFCLEIILMILHFLDKFLRNYRTDLVEFHEMISRARNAIQNMKNKTGSKPTILENLSNILNFYVLKNTRKIPLKSQDDLELFIKQFLCIEEVLFGLECNFENGFDESLEFFNSVLEESNCKNEDAKNIKLKIQRNQ